MSTRYFLKPGDRYTLDAACLDPKTYVCVRVSPGSAVVRSETTTRETFETGDGNLVDFDRPGRRFHICPAPLGITLLEEIE